MAPASNEEQFKFLISCIRYSNNGKVDFSEVAKECSIVSKGAAAKRYERLMKAHGISPSGTPTKPASSRVTKTERRNSTSGAKKRKTEAFMGDENDGDDDEEFGMVKNENSMSNAQNFQIKEEDTKQHLNFISTDDMAPLNSLHYGQNAYAPTNFSYSPAGFSTPVHSNFMIDAKSPYGFESPYPPDGITPASNTPTKTFGYQPKGAHTPENKGRQESPLIVE
ncbi:hypothetical protein B7463_g2930, partial [Scytalidium lignicola]